MVNQRTVDNGHQNARPEQILRFSQERVAVDDGQVRAQTRFEDTHAILGKSREGGARGEAAECFVERESLFGMPAAGGLSGGVLRRVTPA